MSAAGSSDGEVYGIKSLYEYLDSGVLTSTNESAAVIGPIHDVRNKSSVAVSIRAYHTSNIVRGYVQYCYKEFENISELVDADFTIGYSIYARSTNSIRTDTILPPLTGITAIRTKIYSANNDAHSTYTLYYRGFVTRTK